MINMVVIYSCTTTIIIIIIITIDGPHSPAAAILVIFAELHVRFPQPYLVFRTKMAAGGR